MYSNPLRTLGSKKINALSCSRARRISPSSIAAPGRNRSARPPYIQGADVGGQYVGDLGLRPLPVGGPVGIEAVLSLTVAVEGGDPKRRRLRSRDDHRQVHVGVFQVLPQHATEGVGTDTAEETGSAAQPGQADSDVARGAAGPGVEAVLPTGYRQQIDECLAGNQNHGFISPAPQTRAGLTSLRPPIAQQNVIVMRLFTIGNAAARGECSSMPARPLSAAGLAISATPGSSMSPPFAQGHGPTARHRVVCRPAPARLVVIG